MVRNPLSVLHEVGHGAREALTKVRGSAAGQRVESAASVQSPQPSDHVLAQLKAGDSALPTLLLTEIVFHALSGLRPLFHAACGVIALSGTLLGPAFKENGLRS